jgi:transcriptional regulator with PAS, ATPase and Fis domain
MAALVSWVAYNNDFILGNEEGENGLKVNPQGTHCDLYNDDPNFQKHYLLSASSQEDPCPRLIQLVQFLRINYQRDVEPVFMDIERSDVINLRMIKTKVHEFILKHQDENLELFISPGTPAMQTAWYMIGWEFGNKVKLFQRRKPSQRREGEPTNEYIKVGKTKLSGTLVLLDDRKKKADKAEMLRTPTLQKKVYDLADSVANTDNVTTLIIGDRGTGKEGLARYIHEQSARNNNPFIAINCGGIPDTLLETLLFGQIKEIATDIGDHVGAFEKAHRGTIFLDEIGDVSPRLQASLLRVLQERTVTRLGEVAPRKIDVRLISATNKNIPELINQGKLRADLYDRIRAVKLRIPSLIELPRVERLQFINHMNDLKASYVQFNRPKLKLSPEAKDKLLSYTFPGNIRELAGIMDHLYTFCEETVTPDDLPEEVNDDVLNSALDWQENINRHLIKVLKMQDGNVSAASRLMNVSPTTIRNRINKYHLDQ